MADSGLETAARLLKRLRSGDRLDDVARDHGTTVAAVRKAFASLGIGRRDLAVLRSLKRTPTLRLPEGLAPFATRGRRASETRSLKPTRWSDQDILQALETASTMAFPLTASEYDKLREERQIQGPGSLTIAQRFGSWARACEIADVECGRAPRDSYARSWTKHDLIAFVRDYLSSTYAPSSGGYSEWAARTEGAPSAATIRNQLGPWSEVKQIAVHASLQDGRR